METCSDNHKEIVFIRYKGSTKCPVCEALERIEGLEEEGAEYA